MTFLAAVLVHGPFGKHQLWHRTLTHGEHPCSRVRVRVTGSRPAKGMPACIPAALCADGLSSEYVFDGGGGLVMGKQVFDARQMDAGS
eukprot:365025-Chlamydomonas_euryale.AAC.10